MLDGVVPQIRRKGRLQVGMDADIAVFDPETISELGYQIDPDIGQVAYQSSKGETLTVNSHFDSLPIDALIVVKGGNVLYERYTTMAPTDKHILFSCTKITGSTVLAFLEQEGKIDVDRPVSDYVEELKGSVWDTVRLVEALDMATGLDAPSTTNRRATPAPIRIRSGTGGRRPRRWASSPTSSSATSSGMTCSS